MTIESELGTRAELAALGREYLLAGHLIDRAGMPQLIGAFGMETMRDVAIEEWMAASPVYTRRVQKLLGFVGDDVATIFKGMQFDIGAPPEFMDFRYEVHDAHHGEFRLAHCGALMDVEPMGDEFVVAMCHHIEDPTFDATACTTNAKAQVRPIHRPPRQPADRHPHCHWTVTIDDSFPAIEESPFTMELARSHAAHLDVPSIASSAGDDDGMADYSGELDPDLTLDLFSADALAALLDEFCLQGQLLTRAFMLAIERRAGVETALEIGRKQLTGIGGLTSTRLARHLGVAGGLSGIARVVAVHPVFRPSSYVSVSVGRGDASLRIALLDCVALDEGDDLTWPALLVGGHDRGMAAIVQAVDPRAGCVRIDAEGDEVAAWRIDIDEGATPAPVPEEVTLTEFSTGADFRFSMPSPSGTLRQ